MNRYSAVGADACPYGWFVTVIENETVHTETYSHFEELHEVHSQSDQILVDIPIGLPTDERRRCDERASDLLGCRGLSVFYPPAESAIKCDDYDGANKQHRESMNKGLSQQAFSIAEKIRQVESVVGDKFDRIIKESHPELCFAALNGQPVAYSKSSEYGRGLRLDLLTKEIDDAEEIYREVRDEYPLKEVRRDDILDSMVLAIAAQDNSLTTVPEHPDKNEPRIYYPKFKLPSFSES